ncbi:MAG: hypothetical protein QMC36_02820, partial [Patescibacteria group bacterium]
MGNGSSNGPFLNLGFRPKYLMVKNATRAGTRWIVFDSARSPSNPMYSAIHPNYDIVEDNST